MTYPPGGPGYPSPPPSQFSAPTHQFDRLPEPRPAEPVTPPSPAPSASESQAPDAEPGAGQLPLYLAIGVTVLGFAVFLTGFGPVFDLGGDVVLLTIAPIVAGLLAGVGLLPKQTDRTAIAAVFAVLGFLLVLLVVIGTAAEVGWAFYPFIVFTVLQAIVAVAAVLLDAGVITAPTPKPKYEQPAGYGGYGAPAPYYGQPGQPGQHGQPGYPSQYGSYGPAPQHGGGFGAPVRPAGGYSGPAGAPPTQAQSPQPAPPQAPQPPQAPSASYAEPQSGPPTPPTGFPAFGQPQALPESAAAPSDEGASHATVQVDLSELQHHTQLAPKQSAPPPS